MTEPGRFEKLADDASSVLRDDPELRLDVRRELLTHLEEKAEALRADGKGEAEAAELAAKAFGEPAKVAEELSDSNRRRMALRGRARLVVRACVVPLAVLAACWTGARALGRSLYLNSMVHVFGDPCEDKPALLELLSPFFPAQSPLDRLSEEQRFLFQGDTARMDLRERRRSIWEAHPDRKGYYAQYAILLPSLLCDPQKDAQLEGVAGEAAWARYDAELRRGEEMDPDNALYPYLRAHPLLLQSTREENPGLGSGSPLIVTNREKLDRAISAYLEATRKPFFRNYTEEVFAEKLRLLGPIERIEDQIGRIGLTAAAIYPEIGHVQSLHSRMPHVASILAEKGRVAEAEELLDSWIPVLRQMNGHSFTLLEMLVCRTIATRARDRIAPAFEKLGNPEKAARTRETAQRVLDAICPPGSAGGLKEEQAVKMHASLLAGLMLPATGKFGGSLLPLDVKSLAPGREMEYLLAERVSLACIQFATAALMLLCAWRIFTVWRLGSAEAHALLLLPSGKEAARILSLSVLLPLGLYLASTRIGGRELNLRTTFPLTAAGLCLLSATIVFLSARLSARFLWSRCRTLGIPVPERSPGKPWLAALAILALLLPLLLPTADLGWIRAEAAGTGLAASALLGLAFDALLRPIRWKRHPVYASATARSQIPMLAGIALVLGMIGEAAFPAAEARLLQQDRVIGPLNEMGFTRIETELVRRVREACAAALPPR